MPESQHHNKPPHIVVLGAGFGGLKFCQTLKGDARVTLVDRHNHHIFQPLLYQVATAGLSAPEVAEPIRSIFRSDDRITALMDTVQRIDLDARRVHLCYTDIAYDRLVIALGGSASFFGNGAWQEHSFPLKTLNDAMQMRWKLLSSFELAENTADEDERRKRMTIVVIGGGPTGVELAGAIAELTRVVFRRDFRNIDTRNARVVLVESGDHLLDMFPADLADKAKQQLESLGVEVVLNQRVTDVCPDHVKLTDDSVIETYNTLWTAGVQANPVVESLGIELGPGGRIPVKPDLSIPGHPDAFAIGDIVTLHDANDQLVPGLAPAAMQMGRHVARIIDDELERSDQRPDAPEDRPPFAYVDKGAMATIGRKRAIAKIRKLELSGMLAWLSWLGVHLIFLVGFRNKLAVLFSWFYSYITFKRGARIIFGSGCGPEGPPDTAPDSPQTHSDDSADEPDAQSRRSQETAPAGTSE